MFSFLQFDKPEFEGAVRVQMDGSSKRLPYDIVSANTPINPNLKIGTRADGRRARVCPPYGLAATFRQTRI